VRGIRDAEKEYGIIGRLIPSIDREASPREANEMVGWVIAHRAPEVVGIGIDYNEVDRPPELFAEAYAAARRAGLKATAHAGEFGTPWTNVRTAIELLRVDRIDHGYTVVDNPDFARRCADSGIVFTVVPQNTYYLKTLKRDRWALDHPIRRMPGLGIRVHPNTDDPTVHKATPSGVWQRMTTAFGFGIQDLRAFMLNGLDGAWIDDPTRRVWRELWTAEFDAAQRRYA
jgi:adenine deaminase